MLDKFVETDQKQQPPYFVKPDKNIASYADWKSYAELELFA